jgi:hypothetical protein
VSAGLKCVRLVHARNVLQPGVDRHEWETEWATLEPLVVETPAEALSELDALVERMMVARGLPLEEAEAREAAEPAIVAEFLEARRISQLVDSGAEVDPGEIGAAVTGYRNLYEYLLDDRQPAE